MARSNRQLIKNYDNDTELLLLIMFVVATFAAFYLGFLYLVKFLH